MKDSRTLFLDAWGKEAILSPNKEVRWRMSVYAIIQQDDRILTVTPTWNNLLELPGGGVEIHENLTDGVIRECLEETGYPILITNNMPLSVWEENFYARPTDTFYHSIIFIFSAKINGVQKPEIINTADGYEIAEVSWRFLSEINANNSHRILWRAISEIKKQHSD